MLKPCCLALSPMLLVATTAPAPRAVADGVLAFRAGDAHRTARGVAMRVQLWSTDHLGELVTLPAGHRGWAFAGGGQSGDGARFRTPGMPAESNVRDLTRADRAVLRYGEPVTVRIVIDHAAAADEQMTMRFVFYTNDASAWTRHEFLVRRRIA